ncbi:MAG: hypothetical protein ACREM8_08225, partial [Vulcanimicrobiaceae bacterium]
MTRNLVFLTVVVALGACGSHPDYGYSGTLQSPSAAVGSTVGGRVVDVLVSDGSTIAAGAVLVR